MSLEKAVKNLKFDKRLTDWSLSNGQITDMEYKKYLDSLPDSAHLVEYIKLGELTQSEGDDENDSDLAGQH